MAKTSSNQYLACQRLDTLQNPPASGNNSQKMTSFGNHSLKDKVLIRVIPPVSAIAIIDLSFVNEVPKLPSLPLFSLFFDRRYCSLSGFEPI